MRDGESAQAPLTGVTGVALAGGRSTRMGSDKAALALGGIPMIARVVERLRCALVSVIVIGPPRLAALTPDTPVVADLQPGLGPLGGLYTALNAVETPWIALVGCDMPFVEPALVRRIAEMALASTEYDAVALRTPGGWEPLHAAYHRNLAPVVTHALAGPHPSMRGLLNQVRVLEIPPEEVARLDPSGLSTFNANVPEEWRRAERLARERDDGSSQPG